MKNAELVGVHSWPHLIAGNRFALHGSLKRGLGCLKCSPSQGWLASDWEVTDLPAPEEAIASPGARAVLTRDELWTVFIAHLRCDWGEVDEPTKKTNESSVVEDKIIGPIVSIFTLPNGLKIKVVSEAKPYVTKIMMAEEDWNPAS